VLVVAAFMATKRVAVISQKWPFYTKMPFLGLKMTPRPVFEATNAAITNSTLM